MFSSPLLSKAEQVLALVREKGIMLTTAESCTGGLIAALLTEIAGASDVFDCGFITYSYEAKQTLLGVPESLIVRCGAVSKEVAIAMAEGALRRTKATLSVSVTGIAGPGGSTVFKPVGLVHMASAMTGKAILHRRHHFAGDRSTIRLCAVQEALTMILEQL